MSRPSAKLEVGASEADSVAPRGGQRGATRPASGTTEGQFAEADRDRLIDELRLAQDRMSADLEAMTRLHRLGSLFVREGNLEPVLVEIVDAAIAISGADFGNIQLLDAESSDLRIVAQRGFPDWWLEFWNSVSRGQGVCGTALQRGERVIVEDVEHSPIFAGTPALEIQRKAGVRAVQSTPLLSRSGKPLGMFSTHWRKPGRPDERSLRLLDLLGRHAADITERAQNEAALLRHGELLQRVFEKIPVLLVMWDPRLRRFTLNQKAEEVLGLSTTEANERDLMSAVYPDAEYRAEAAAFMQSLQPEFREWIGRSKSGEDVPIGWANIRLTDETMIGVGVDLRERKRAEEALRESEERFRLLVHGVKDYAIYMFAHDGTVRSWSAAAEQIFGYREDEIVGQHRGIFFTPEQRADGRADRELECALTDGRHHEEGWRVRKDGSRFFADVLITALWDDAGRLRGFASVTRDVTERRRSEAALRESEERLRVAQQAARVGSFEWDLRSRVNTWTPEMEALYGLPPGGFARVEGAWVKLVHPDDRDEAVRIVQRALEPGGPTEWEWRVVWPDGSVRWLAGRWKVLRDRTGEPVRVTGINIDITDQKRAEELRASEAALREADRQKNQFLAMLSHELRNPLAPIRNSLYLLERAAAGGEHARRAMAVIDRQVGHMTRLIDDLLDVTRIVRGKVRLQREDLGLNDLVQRTVEDHRTLFSKGEIRLEVLAAPDEVRVNGDPVRLAQAIGNLLQNAAKFTPHGGATIVSVQTDSARGEAVVTVRDTGTGIQPEMLPRLFHAFSQADSTLDRSKGGLGLGLALVKGLAEMHGGSVSAASDGPGKGAAFTIRLPLDVAGARAIPPKGEVPGVRGARRRVLVVEDNEDAADTLREVLELGEHVVEVAYSGRGGIEKARAFHPDIVLCDIGLPEMDGYEVARRMRADPQLSHVALVAVSGYAQPEDVAMAKEAGFDAHLTKPPSIEALERALAAGGNTRPGTDRPG
jgi:two-component system CheB/CheR fusion protein